MAGQRLVDRIVGDLEHHVVEARAVVGVADIHSGPLADRVEAFQHLDRIGAVAVFIGGGCHADDIGDGGPKPKEISGFRQLFRRCSIGAGLESRPEPLRRQIGSNRRRASAADSGRTGPRSVPVIQTWPPPASSRSNKAARRARVEMGGDLVEQQDRPAARALGDEIGMGEDDRRAAAPSARRSSTAPAGWLLPRWVTARSVRCGPARVRPAAASRARPRGERSQRQIGSSPPSSARPARANGPSGAAASRSASSCDGRRRAPRRARRHARPSAPRARRARPRRAALPRRAACCAPASPLRSGRRGRRGRARARAPAGRGSGGARRRLPGTAGPSPESARAPKAIRRASWPRPARR